MKVTMWYWLHSSISLRLKIQKRNLV